VLPTLCLTFIIYSEYTLILAVPLKMQVEKIIQQRVLMFVAAAITATMVLATVGYIVSQPVSPDTSVSDPNKIPPGACTKDLRACADGSVVARDPGNKCEFRACPNPVTTPPSQVLTCCNQPDWLSCKTPSHEQKGIQACQANGCAVCQETTVTPSGSTSSSSSSQKSTGLTTGPGEVFCTLEVAACTDGSYVGRDPNNDCQFKTCPDGSEPASSL
jgi:hypothetical protein